MLCVEELQRQSGESVNFERWAMHSYRSLGVKNDSTKQH